MSSRTVIPIPPSSVEPGSNFWRCKKCAKVNFRTATLCSGCDTPSSGGSHDHHDAGVMSPASIGYLRSSAAVAVNAKVSSLQEMLEEQRKKYERDLVTLRKQLDTALNAHNSLLSSQRQYSVNKASTLTAATTAATGGDPKAAADVAALESGYQQQIAMLQQQQHAASKERDESNQEVIELKRKLEGLVSRVEGAATVYAGAMDQLAESEKARNALLEKINNNSKSGVAPPVPGTVGASSSAIKNLEEKVNDLSCENASLKAQLQTLLLHQQQSPMTPTLSKADTVNPEQAALLQRGPGSGAFQLTPSSSSPSFASADALIQKLRATVSAKVPSRSAEIDAAIDQLAEWAAQQVRETGTLREVKESLQKQREADIRELEGLEDELKEKNLEAERERDVLKKKLAAVEREVQEADSRERDACLTMNAMDAILSDSLWALRQQQQQQQQHPQLQQRVHQ